MIPIQTEGDFARTREYAAKLEDVLLNMRRTHTPEQYEYFSKSFIKELSEAKHEVLLYLAKAPSEAAPVNEEQLAVTA